MFHKLERVRYLFDFAIIHTNDYTLNELTPARVGTLSSKKITVK